MKILRSHKGYVDLEWFRKRIRIRLEDIFVEVLFFDDLGMISRWERNYFKFPFKKIRFLKDFRMEEIFLNFEFRIWFLDVLRKRKNEN